MRMNPLARLHGGIASRDLPAFQINDMTTFINLPGASAKIWLWSVGAKAVSTFYGRMTDAMRTDPFERLHKKVESVSGLACFSKQRYDNFHQSTRGVGQKMALERRGSGRIYLLRTHYGLYAYGPVSEATWGDSGSGLACFSNQRYDNFHQSTRGVGQHMTLERRG
ncbi:hypothetical protein GN958_ATG07527 [Phytophthora infestans]|uniref:Uncharacterized protein n=1 Tax=Phytophthora infestans TaxID=4787 RepID=A0A8S9UWC8_PHYIN|nr:hypothetical protein GN958_ATG07527 [Phytophthora infestans]